MAASLINHLLREEAKPVWHTIPWLLRPLLKDMRCSLGEELRGCRHWKAILEIHPQGGSLQQLEPGEPLPEPLQGMQLDGEDTMTIPLLRNMVIAPFQTIRVAYYDLRQQGDAMDLSRATLP